MSMACLCPGQGAQTPGFLHRLPSDVEVAQTCDEASAALSLDVLTLDTADALQSTVAVQLATVVAGVAVGRALAARGAVPDAVAGLSVGAYTAAVLSGALQLPAALSVVRIRAELMERAYPYGYGLAAVVGLGERTVAAIVEEIERSGTPVYLANLNAATQFVLAGSDAGLELALERARAAGARTAERMAVAVPSHCRLLGTVGDALAVALRPVPLAPPRLAYVTNRRARVTFDPEEIREDLSRNVQYPVRFGDAIAVMYETGARLFVEVPPGRSLTGLAEAAFPEARALAAEETTLQTISLLASRERSLGATR
jgi:malonate decarboxylase epsilon subunit